MLTEVLLMLMQVIVIYKIFAYYCFTKSDTLNNAFFNTNIKYFLQHKYKMLSSAQMFYELQLLSYNSKNLFFPNFKNWFTLSDSITLVKMGRYYLSEMEK